MYNCFLRGQGLRKTSSKLCPVRPGAIRRAPAARHQPVPWQPAAGADPVHGGGCGEPAAATSGENRHHQDLLCPGDLL